MRIIYLHQYFNTPEMAGSTRSYEMARRLVAAGHEVHMVTTWRDSTNVREWFQTDESGVIVHWLPLRYSNHMSFWQRLRAFIRFAFASTRKAVSLPGDVVFATSTPLTIAIPGILASRWKGIPMVFEVRDLWPDVPVALGILRNPIAVRAAYLLERLAYTLSARVVALAPGMKEVVASRGVAESAIAVIPNGCDLDVFATPNGDAMVHPAIEKGSHVILYAGAMGIVNGVEYIPRVAAELRKVAPDLRIHFVMLGDGKQREYAQGVAEELGVLNQSVHFFGSRPKREVASWLASADATIITYDGPEIVFRDSVSNKFFDSLAAGKPVMGNYSGFATLKAANAGAGFILSRDPSEAAAEVVRLFSDPDILRRAGSAAASLAREEFSRDRLAARLEQLLLDVVHESQSA